MRLFCLTLPLQPPKREINRVLNPWTLRFFRKDFEQFYLEHHWQHMSYWLWGSVVLLMVYTAMSIIFGDLVESAFDVRMDHYTKGSALKEAPAWVEEDISNRTTHSNRDPSIWRQVKVIEFDAGHRIPIPRGGFLAWHMTWCLLFLAILLIDRVKHRCFRGRAWIMSRTWVAFAIMFLDLVITSFLNPSVARFMVFVYALLIRVQFVQTVVLVSLSSLAMLSAGYIGTHEFLNSISVAEFLILNLVCLSAARQIEIHSRLSLYRLWYIMVKNNSQDKSSPRSSSALSEANLARNLLSLDELALDPILEVDETLESSEWINQDPDVELGVPGDEFSPQQSGTGTPSSHTMSVKSVGTPEPVARPIPTRTSRMRPHFGRHVKRPLSRKRNRITSKDGAASSDNGSNSDSDRDKLSECGSLCSGGFQPEQLRLPPWLCLEGVDRFKQSFAPDYSDGNRWAEVGDLQHFNLRGLSYMDDRIKQPAGMAAFQLHQARLFQTKAPLIHVAQRLPSLTAFLRSHPENFFFIYNRIIPYEKNTLINMVVLLARQIPQGEDVKFDTLFDTFLAHDDSYRNRRLKHLCRFREAPSVVRSAIWMVGGEQPVIIGKGYLEQQHFVGPNYVEVDVDISPSRMAKSVVGKVIHHGKKVVMEEMIVIEGQSENELPERPIGAWRWVKVEVSQALLELDESTLNPPQESLSEEQRSTLPL